PKCAGRAAPSTPCWPTTACSIWRPTCGGSTSPPPGCSRFPRRYEGDRRAIAGTVRRFRAAARGEGRSEVFRADAGPAGRQPGGGGGRDRGGDGPERFGQVDAAALPGRHPHPRPGRGPVRRPPPRHDGRGAAQRAAPGAVRVRVPVRSARARAHRRGERGAAAPARREAAGEEARAWFERLDLQGLEERRSGELSGGQAQRVALARALVARPQVVFADEPTGSLDSLSGEHVMELLVAASREQGTTVVLVTHDARVAAYAEREVVVRDGTVTALLDRAAPGRAALDRAARP